MPAEYLWILVSCSSFLKHELHCLACLISSDNIVLPGLVRSWVSVGVENCCVDRVLRSCYLWSHGHTIIHIHRSGYAPHNSLWTWKNWVMKYPALMRCLNTFLVLQALLRLLVILFSVCNVLPFCRMIIESVRNSVYDLSELLINNDCLALLLTASCCPSLKLQGADLEWDTWTVS